MGSQIIYVQNLIYNIEMIKRSRYCCDPGFDIIIIVLIVMTRLSTLASTVGHLETTYFRCSRVHPYEKHNILTVIN